MYLLRHDFEHLGTVFINSNLTIKIYTKSHFTQALVTSKLYKLECKSQTHSGFVNISNFSQWQQYLQNLMLIIMISKTILGCLCSYFASELSYLGLITGKQLWEKVLPL